MSPSGNSADPAIDAALVPPGVLNEGEIVILAIKPHPLFVLLASWPVIAVCALVAAGAYLMGAGIATFPSGAVVTLAALVGAVRVMIASVQWLGRMYVLTNRRLLWIFGTIRLTVVQCPLKSVRQTRVAESSVERILGLGTVLFTLDEQTISGGGWVNISQPHMVREAVEDAIGKLPPRPHQP